MKASDSVAPVVVVRSPGRTDLRLVLTEALEVGRAGPGLLLDDPAISRRHLELRPDGPSVIVTDLGSANGTTVDGQALLAPMTLPLGSVVALGDVRIQVDSPHPLGGATPSAVHDHADTPATAIERVAEDVIRRGPASTRSADNPHEGQTRTIVFSDIERSTDLAVGLGDVAWFELLGVHNSILRSCLTAHAGHEVKSQGDGFMLTFASARRAVAFMIELQERLAADEEMQAHALRVRVGAHTGEAVEDDGDLFGRAVIVAARIGSAAAGGEILVSSLVREIVESWDEVDFAEPRIVPLKGLAGKWTLHSVVWDNRSNGRTETA